eukprot:Skav212374  [mRNA]  locus=scaffold1983:89537:93846:+ [translate_table: standard]
MAVMVSCVEDTFERISAEAPVARGRASTLREAGNLHRRGDSKTLTTRDIQSAVRLVFPGELSRHAVSEGCKARAAVIAFKGGQADDDEEEEEGEDEDSWRSVHG